MITKTCVKHGELHEKDIYMENDRGISRARCRLCKLMKDEKYRKNNREELVKKQTIYKKYNRKRTNEWVREDRKKNPEKYLAWERAKRARYGAKGITQEILRIHKLTQEQYDQMFIQQDNKCGICGKHETRKSRTPGKICRLVVDHCHKSNLNSSLLCHACNIAIGKFNDDVELMQKAIDYINHWKQKHAESVT